MATTTNYGWTTPDDTALVKDGAAAIRTLGSSVDTTTKALNPSTTLGDIEYRSATANTNSRLALGNAGQVLRVNSGATAPEWGTSGLTLVSTTSIGTAVSTVSVNNVFTSIYQNYKVIIEWIGSSASTNVNLRLRASGTDNSTAFSYQPKGYQNVAGTLATYGAAAAQLQLGSIVNNDYDTTLLEIIRPATANYTYFASNHYEGSNNSAYQFMAAHLVSTSYDGFTVYPTTGTLTNGTIYVYGYGK